MVEVSHPPTPVVNDCKGTELDTLIQTCVMCFARLRKCHRYTHAPLKRVPDISHQTHLCSLSQDTHVDTRYKRKQKCPFLRKYAMLAGWYQYASWVLVKGRELVTFAGVKTACILVLCRAWPAWSISGWETPTGLLELGDSPASSQSSQIVSYIDLFFFFFFFFSSSFLKWNRIGLRYM